MDKIIQALRFYQPAAVVAICASTGLPEFLVKSTLTKMISDGTVKRVGEFYATSDYVPTQPVSTVRVVTRSGYDGESFLLGAITGALFL